MYIGIQRIIPLDFPGAESILIPELYCISNELIIRIGGNDRLIHALFSVGCRVIVSLQDILPALLIIIAAGCIMNACAIRILDILPAFREYPVIDLNGIAELSGIGECQCIARH